MPTDTRPSCGRGNHTWMFRRYYSGIEVFFLTEITDGQRGLAHNEVNPPDQNPDIPLFVTVGERDADDYDDDGPGRVELFCTQCPATIDGALVTEVS